MILLILLGTLAATVLAGFYSGFETAAYRASTVRLRSLAAQNDLRAQNALGLLRHINRLVTTTLIGHNLSVYLGTFLLTHYIESSNTATAAHNAEAWATAILTPVFFIFAETLPKRIAHFHANQYLLRGARIARFSRWFYRPLGVLLGLMGKYLQALLQRLGYRTLSSTGRKRLLEHIEASVAHDLLTPEQHEMIERILSIQHAPVRDIMLPMEKSLTVPETISCREAAEKMTAAGYRRVPLTGRNGKPTGTVIFYNDILRNPASIDQPVHLLARTLPAVHANTRVNKALHRLREKHSQIALVLGRGDSAIGFVTVSDLFNSIVGAIRQPKNDNAP